jgi:hypothetical protein
MSKKLTDKQQKFLDVLFDEAEGDPVKAKRLAGYSNNCSTTEIVNSLQDEIYELTKKFIARSSTKAAFAMASVLDRPMDIGNKEKMAAAKDILDRAGLVKTEKVEIKSKEPVFILPAKREED